MPKKTFLPLGLPPTHFNSVQFSRSVVPNSLQPHRLQHARPPCPSPTPGAYSKSCPLSWWCHLIISSSVIPFFSCPQSPPALQVITEHQAELPMLYNRSPVAIFFTGVYIRGSIRTWHEYWARTRENPQGSKPWKMVVGRQEIRNASRLKGKNHFIILRGEGMLLLPSFLPRDL